MREWLRSAGFIARTDLWFMLRQRETLLWVFGMPLLFFYFIGTVTGGFGGGPSDRPDPLALQTPAPDGVVLDAIVRRLEERNFKVNRPAAAGAEQSGRRLSIPAFTADSIRAGTQAEATLALSGNSLSASFAP